MAFTGAAFRVDVSGGLGQGETRPQGVTGIGTTGYVIGRTNDRIIEIADMSDPDTSVFVSASIGNSNSMAAHNGSLFVFIGTTLKRFDPPFSATDEGTDVLIITGDTPRALTSDGTNLWYINQIGTGNVLVRIDDIDGTPDTTAIGSISGTSNFRGLVWHDGFFWGVDPSTDALYVIDESDYSRTQVGSFSQFVGPIVTPQGLGVVDGVGYIVANDNSGSIWELRDFKFTAEIADQSWLVGTAVSVSAPATEDGETPITYAISPALPAGVSLDTSTGGISGTPTATDDATDYTLTATDDNGIEATTTFSASVVGATNNAPSFSESSYSFSDIAIAVNTVVGTVAATDADDDTLSYSLTGTDASNFSIDSDGEITVATALTNSTTYNFNVVADDQTDTTSVAVAVTAIAAAVTPTLGWTVPSEAVGNTFEATLTSNVELDAAPTVGDLRLRDDDNSDSIVALNSSNTTITAIAGTNNYLIEIVLTGTYDDDYTIRINGNTVEYNGVYVIATQLASAVFRIDSSIGVNNAPSFADASYTFDDVAIALNTVVGTVAATDADDDTLSYSITGTDASKFDIDSDGEITVAEELDYGESYAINVVADDQTDTTTVAVTINADTTTPRAPTITEDSTTHNSVTIDITAGDDGGEAVTDWEYELDGDGTWNSFGSTDLEQTISNLESETTYSIKARGINSEGNGIASTALSSTTDVAPNNAPEFANASYAFTDIAIAVNTVVSTVAATDADNDTLSYSLTGTNASNFSIDANGQITVATALTNSDTYNFNVVADDSTDTTSVAVTVTAIAAVAPPVWQTGAALEESVDAGESTTIDIGAKVSGEDTIEEVFGVSLRRWLSFGESTNILTITDAPTVRKDTEITLRFRAGNDDGTRDADLTLTLNGSVLASLHNSLYFYECRNYNDDNDRITVRGATTTVPEMVDNDYSTYSDEDDVDVNIADADGNATTVDYVFVKYKGTLTSYTVTPTGGTGSAFTRTVPTTIENFEGAEVSLEINGWKHDLFPLSSEITATSVRLQFTGTNLEVYALMLLELGQEIEANESYTNFGFNLVDRSGSIVRTPGGRGRRLPSLANARWKWEHNLTMIRDTVRMNQFRQWVDDNPNCVVSLEFSRDPEMVYPAFFPSLSMDGGYFTDVKSNGEQVSFSVAER